MESKKYNKLVNTEKKSRLIDTENKLVVCSGERPYRGRELKVQTIRYSISYKDREYSQYFYNNYKRKITFKNCESLCCTPVPYIIFYINYD